MSTSYKQTKQFKIGISKVVNLLNENFKKEYWEISLDDSFELKGGKRVHQFFGISEPLSGSTLASFFFQGARHVPFFVKVLELTNRSVEITVTCGGSESFWGLDYGRHEGLAKLIFSFLENEE